MTSLMEDLVAWVHEGEQRRRNDEELAAALDAAIQATFDLMDADNDGYIVKEEACVIARSLSCNHETVRQPIPRRSRDLLYPCCSLLHNPARSFRRGWIGPLRRTSSGTYSGSTTPITIKRYACLNSPKQCTVACGARSSRI